MPYAKPLGPTTIASTFALALCVSCSATDASDPPFTGELAKGTWGGDSGGLIVGDTAIHLHVGCTFGDISGTLKVDSNGKFSVPGRYMVRAYPVAVGPPLPAVFTGYVAARSLTITATVNDTVMRQIVVKGPVTLSLGVPPRMPNCPICRDPFTGASRRVP